MRAAGALAIIAGFTVGCATAPEIYSLPSEHYVAQQLPIPDGKPQIEQGRPNVVLDGLNHYLISLPTKALLWNWHALDHRLPEDHEGILNHYLQLNQLRSVKVRHNEYAPISEFQRLRKNKEVGVLYRSSLGFITWLRYTLLPDRLLAGLPIIGGGDHFNPFTNTINVYSSDLAILLHEAGHAKDYLQHDWKGTSFALIRLLPGIDLLQEARASTDAIRYLYCIRDEEHELHAYKTLIPAYSTYVAGYFQGGLEVTLPIVFGGHVTGRLQSRERGRALTREAEAPESAVTRADFLPEWCKPIPHGTEDALPASEGTEPPLPLSRPLHGEASWTAGSEPGGSDRVNQTLEGSDRSGPGCRDCGLQPRARGQELGGVREAPTPRQ